SNSVTSDRPFVEARFEDAARLLDRGRVPSSPGTLELRCLSGVSLCVGVVSLRASLRGVGDDGCGARRRRSSASIRCRRPERSAACRSAPAMTLDLLTHAIVRQTTILIAQLATAHGGRAPLAQVANQVFLDLVRELERQGVSRKVSADMFGVGLRTY